MPSLYKSVAVESGGKVNVPVSEVRSKTVAADIEANAFDKAVEVVADGLFKEKWKAAITELALERARMLQEVDAERQRVLSKAEQEGYKTGITNAKSEADKLMQQVHTAYKALENDRTLFIEQSRAAILELVVTVSEAFLHEQLQQTPELLVSLASRAIDELVSKRKVCVFVNPVRVETIRAHTYLLPGTADGDEVIVRPDPTLDADSIRVEDETGSVVVSLNEHIAKVRQVLSDA